MPSPMQKGMKSLNPHGRPKGSMNKTRMSIFRDMVMSVANESNSRTLLKKYKKEDPKGFFQLAAGFVPKEANLNVDTKINVQFAFKVNNDYEKVIDVGSKDQLPAVSEATGSD